MCNYIGISLAIHLACVFTHNIANTPMSLALELIKLLQLVAIDHTGIPVMFLPVKVLWLFYCVTTINSVRLPKLQDRYLNWPGMQLQEC